METSPSSLVSREPSLTAKTLAPRHEVPSPTTATSAAAPVFPISLRGSSAHAETRHTHPLLQDTPNESTMSITAVSSAPTPQPGAGSAGMSHFRGSLLALPNAAGVALPYIVPSTFANASVPASVMPDASPPPSTLKRMSSTTLANFRSTSLSLQNMRTSMGMEAAPRPSLSSLLGFTMAIPKDASKLLLHPLDVQRGLQHAFAMQDQVQQLEELEKQGRVAMLRQQQERRVSWARESAAASLEMTALWDAVSVAVRDRRTSLQPDGYQTFSFPDGTAVYEGNWKNCHPHGKGCLRRSEPLNDVYEGQWFVGQRCGTGTYHSGDHHFLYQGSWLDDKAHGKGELMEPGGVYTGEFVENTLHGYGEYVYQDEHVYKGEWVRGLYEGNGTYLYPSGTKYEGQWRRGYEHGRGTKWYHNGDVYNGEWRHGVPHGTGTFTSRTSTALRVSGQWRYGSLHGQASCVFADGSRYEGEWQGGRFHGRGTFEAASGNARGIAEAEAPPQQDRPQLPRYTGSFVNGKRHGYGEYTAATVAYAGDWVQDKKEGEGSLQMRGGGTYFGRWKADVPDGEGVYVSTYRKGLHGEVHCAAVGGKFDACVDQKTEVQVVDLRLAGRS